MMHRAKTSQILKKISIWVFVLITLVCVCLLPKVSARATTNFNSLQSSADAKLAGYAMAQCMDQLYNRQDKVSIYDTSINDVWVYSGLVSGTTGGSIYVGSPINIGPGFEKVVGGNNDGKINCTGTSNKHTDSDMDVADIFAKNLGVSTSSIICNGERPGLMKLQYYNGSEYVDSKSCTTTPTDGTKFRYVLNDRAGADAYLNSLAPYDWGTIKENPFPTNADKYYVNLRDFMAVCTDGTTANSGDEVDWDNYYSTPITTFDAATNTTKKVYYKKDDRTKTFGSTYFLSGVSSCGDLIQTLNNQANRVFDDTIKADEELLEKDREGCNKDVQALVDARKNAANEIIKRYTQSGLSNSSQAQSAIQAAQDWLNRLNKFEKENKDKYYEEKDGAVTCLQVPANDGGSTEVPTVSGPKPPTESTPPSNNGGGQSLDEIAVDNSDISICKKTTSLGWVVCPFMNLIGNAAMGLYESIEDRWIAINADEVSVNKPIYTAWQQFRDYANIGFAIIFGLVVFSQVTGIGLSNYSIKKMLPTLIMVAVLVNISFFICQLAIDVTNIIGNGLGETLQDIGKNVGASELARTGFSTAKEATGALFGAAGIGLAGYAAGTIVLPLLGSTVILPVILAGISALVGFFFLFILLALREAVVYVVIILSPLAFICYALPNMKGVLDKWKKLFLSLLLVYPICQVLVYGGQMMAIMLMANKSDQGFFYQFTALLMQIIPIFLIPMVLRSSLSALGNIGAKISAMGSKMGQGLSRATGNTQLAKRAATSMNKWGAMRTMKRLNKTPRTTFGRKIQDTALSKALRSNATAKAAGSLAAAEELRSSDKINKNVLNKGYMESVAATNDLKAEEDLADKYINGLRNGIYTDDDGNAYDMNDLGVKVDDDDTSSDGALEQLYEQALRENDTVKIKGLTKYLMNVKGGKGFAVIGAAMKKDGIAFKADGSMHSYQDKERSGFNTAAQYLSGNDKWNMMMKRWDPNTTNLVNDGAMLSDAKTIDRGVDENGEQRAPRNRTYYNIGASGKVTPAQMTGLDDGFFNGMRDALYSQEGIMAMNNQTKAGEELRASLSNYNAHAQEAFDNPRIYSQMGGSLRDMQKVHEKAQEFDIMSSILDMNKRNNLNVDKARELLKAGIESGRYKISDLVPSPTLRLDHKN